MITGCYFAAAIGLLCLCSLVFGTDSEGFGYKPLCNYTFTPAVPVPKDLTDGDTKNAPSFIIVIPYTKSYLLQFPESNRTIQSWREYATLHGYQLRLVDSTPIVKEHGQSLISSVEKRHGSIYVTGKPLVALVTFRALSQKETIDTNTWMVFVDVDTMVANPYYLLEDLITYSNHLGQQAPMGPFQGYNQSQTSSSSSSPKSNKHECHMIGQLAPSTINSGFILFPFTATAHSILQDWAQQTLDHSLRNEDWQGDQGVLQTLVLRHLQQILIREHPVAKESPTNPDKESNRKLVGAKKPAQMNHKSLRDHQFHREKTAEKLKSQYHKRQEQKLKDAKESKKPSLLLDTTEDASTSPGETLSFWNMLFGTSSLPTDISVSSNKDSTFQSNKSSSSIGLPHGICIQKAGNVARGHCFGRTLRDSSVYWDNARTRPFCLLSAQSSIGIFNVHDWPLSSESYSVVAETLTGGISQYAVDISPVSPAMAAMSSYRQCHRFAPPFYHGRNASLIRQIPLLSELSTSQKRGLQRYYERVLSDSQRTDLQRLFPRATLSTRTECDHFWKHILVRHIDSCDSLAAVSSPVKPKFAKVAPTHPAVAAKRKRNIP